MRKRRKMMRLPDGFGSIRYLGDHRRNCYAVHPPAKLADDLGDYVRPRAICYVDDWYVGFAVLNAYHAGTYRPGDEAKYRRTLQPAQMDELCQRILADFTAAAKTGRAQLTFANVYDKFYDHKFGDGAKRKLSASSMQAARSAYKNCAALHDKPFAQLRHADLQGCIDACPLGYSSVSQMIQLIKQMYQYAMLYELCDKDYSTALKAPENDTEHGVPFTAADLAILWRHADDPTVELALIMCYSGFRISAYLTIETNVEHWYFRGGVKTASGKDRIVPIHSAIQPLVAARLRRDGRMLSVDPHAYRKDFYAMLSRLGISRHTPHDCRHTFSMLCERYGVSENDRKRMLGHSFGSDITNAVYGHRDLEDLRREIEKIQVVTTP